MHKKPVFYLSYLPVYITVLVLFFFIGQNFTGVANSPNDSNTKFSKTAFLKNSVSKKLFFSEKKSGSTLPEEPPIIIEEQEDDDSNDDKNNNGVIIPDWAHYGQKLIQPITTSVNPLICNNGPRLLSVPLYILFHSQKDYLI